jgi:hypothetical protein
MEPGCSPLRIKPELVDISTGRRGGDLFVRRAFFFQMFPHADHQSFTIPPVKVVFPGFFPVALPDFTVTREGKLPAGSFTSGQLSGFFIEIYF